MNIQSTQPSSIPSFIQTHVSLHDKNWFKTGGNAHYYCEPLTYEEFAVALLFAKENHLEVFVLGEGANILISDNGFAGLVIRPKLDKISIIRNEDSFSLVNAQAGVEFQQLIDFCLKNQLIGLEEFSGIPGTVGGSVYINIHYFEFLLSQFLVQATVIEKTTGYIMTVDNAWFNFDYDTSALFDQQYYLLDATFKLKNCTELEAAYAQGRRDEIIRHRVRRYPNANTCGSFFRNFHDNEVSLEVNGKKMIFVAYYLDKLGVKGVLQKGGARVSHQHANMLVTSATATSQDVIDLVRTMQELVSANYGIIPQPECQLIGFKEYPLL